MVKHIQIIGRLLPTNCLSVLDHYVGLALKRGKEPTVKQRYYYCYINPFLPNVPILYPLKTPENLWFLSIFRGYKMGTSARNGLKIYININNLKYEQSYTCYLELQ